MPESAYEFQKRWDDQRELNIKRRLEEGDDYELTDHRRMLALVWDYANRMRFYTTQSYADTEWWDLRASMIDHGISQKILEQQVANTYFGTLIEIKIEPKGFRKRAEYLARAGKDLIHWKRANPANPTTGGNPWHDPRRRPL